jgi:RNA polymerase sigma-70 factor (ECF subfamily)
MENEVELLHKCLNGSNDAFGGIVAKYQSLVCAITYSATGDTALSEDMAQEVFVNAWKNLTQLKDLSKFHLLIFLAFRLI